MNMPPPPPPIPPGGFVSGAAGPGDSVLAPAWKRIVARLIDAIIGVLIAGSIFSAIVLSEGESLSRFGTGDVGTGKVFTIALLGLLFGFLYEAVTTKMFGGTPGKLILGMKVVRADNGAAVGWNESVIRWGAPAVLSLIPGIGGIIGLVIVIVNLVFLFTDKRRQTVWDKCAKTVVVGK